MPPPPPPPPPPLPCAGSTQLAWYRLRPYRRLYSVRSNSLGGHGVDKDSGATGGGGASASEQRALKLAELEREALRREWAKAKDEHSDAAARELHEQQQQREQQLLRLQQQQQQQQQQKEQGEISEDEDESRW